MADTYTAQVISQDALRWINFFNGRLLTGDDLTQEQSANRDARFRLGQALGDGVAWGLQVKGTPGDVVVSVSAGEAVNREGQVLYLSQPQTVSLLQAPKTATTTRVRWFNACDTSQSSFSGDVGLYLLTLCPAEGVEDRAPLSGLSSTVTACNSKYRVEGVQFKLILIASTIENIDQFRNTVAYQDFFAIDTISSSLEVPFGTQYESYGRLDGLRPDPLTDEDVPLAVILRDVDGIVYVDNWAVRRRVRSNTHTPYTPWPLFISDRRTSEAEAIFLQFQEQLADIMRYKAKIVPNMNAAMQFNYLPPAGFLPIGNNGFDWHTFLGSHAPATETQIDSGLLDEILLTALVREPFPVETEPYAALDVYKTPDDSFVLFARSASGRFQLQFGSGTENLANLASDLARIQAKDRQALVEYLKKYLRQRSLRSRNQPLISERLNYMAYLVISTPGSNLEYRVTPDQSGVFVSPNLAPGTYRIRGNLAGLGAIGRKNVSIIGGLITTSVIPINSLFPGRLNLDAGSFRLCLVPGTFPDAVKQVEVKPWARAGMIEIGVEKPANPSDEVHTLIKALTYQGNLKKAVVDRLVEWGTMLADRFPDLEIDSSDPKLYVHGAYNRPLVENSKRASQSLPEVPQIYAVFGNFGVPLTMIEAIQPDQELTMLSSLSGTVLTNDTLLGDLTLYGIITADQIAGAWVQVIVEATGLTSKLSRDLIVRMIKQITKNNA